MLREKGLFLSVYVDHTKIGGKKNNLKLMCDILMEQVDLEEPTSVLDQVCLVCLRRECKPNLKIGQEIKDLLKSPYSNDCLAGRGSHADAVACSHDMKVHANTCVEIR